MTGIGVRFKLHAAGSVPGPCFWLLRHKIFAKDKEFNIPKVKISWI